MGTDSKVVTGDYYDGTANPPDGIGMGNRDLVAVELWKAAQSKDPHLTEISSKTKTNSGFRT